ncbi:SseB protein N-terminal domain-containing protein [Rhodovulum sp. ES.010]|uniref:SseB family protein n=1 Tax=Rhodovulum sp. ES.010 TaxID=1882821 RepID=UPI000925F182|nr:SseB family protein [Rhodovulum sp. ES.010]SIO55018.1 SseB protein N-terminal domain-containing protein [Rhodovulum sp. ES.010]
MTEPTPLDRAHAAMAAAPDDPAARLRYLGLLAASELVLLLDREAEEDRIVPAVFPLDEGRFVLAFDRETRLTAFTGAPAPYAAMPGRALADLLAGQGLGLAVNPGAAAHDLLPPDAVAWWAETLAPAPAPLQLDPEALTAPGALPEALLAALDCHLAKAGALAPRAWLAGIRYAGGGSGLLLAFEEARPGAEAALARLVAEALRFSGLEAGALDVTFIARDGKLAGALARRGLRIDLAAPGPAAAAPRPARAADAPPRLR